MNNLISILFLIVCLNSFSSDHFKYSKFSCSEEIFYKKFLCSFCVVNFDKKNDLIQHAEITHKNLNFECCKKLVNDGVLCNHFVKVLFCSCCPFFTKSEKTMRLHLNKCIKKLVQPN